MDGIGIFITQEELEQVLAAQKVSGMYLSGGQPMGNPAELVDQLQQKYNAPKDTALNTKTREFVYF
jgi:hypothetical protein